MEENQEMNEMEKMNAMNAMSEMNEEMEMAMASGKAAPANETKNEKFMRLAEYRVNKLMSAISSLDKLHNKSAYDYSEEQVQMMFSSIEEQLEAAKSHFNSNVKAQEAKFSFNK